MNQRMTRITAGASLAAAVFGLAGCSMLPGGTTTAGPTSGSGSSQGSPASTQQPGSTESVFDVHEGDCLSIPETSDGMVSDVTTVPCSAAHEYEVFAEITVTGTTFPGEQALENQGDTECGAKFTSWVADSNEFGYTFLPPSQESWEGNNDRIILCVAQPTAGGQTSGSAAK